MANKFADLVKEGDKLIGADSNQNQNGQSGNQVARLKRQLSRARQENQKLHQALNRPNVQFRPTPRGFTASEAIRQNGQTYQSAPVHLNVFDEDLNGLSQILTDLVQVSRSSARGSRIWQRQPERTRDEEGKPTQARNADNRVLYHSNRLDRVMAQASLLWENPETREALLTISHYIETKEFQDKVDQATVPQVDRDLLFPASSNASANRTNEAEDSPDVD